MHNQFLLAVASAESSSALGGFLIPVVAVASIVALVVTARAVASRYKTVPPNGIGVFYGRKYAYTYTDATGNSVKGTRGFMVIQGGGKIQIPVVEKYDVMSTAAFQVEIQENQVPTVKNVPVQITAVATCRISPNPDEQSNAVQAFLGKHQDEISKTIQEILRGHVRSIIAKLSVEQILRDRAEFNKQVLEESSDEFRKLGIQIITLVVQDVQDSDGYIKALGKKETAAIIRDAAIATAEATKETEIKTSNAQRESATVRAENAALVADAEKVRDIKIAEFRVQTESKKAEADMANAIAKTTQEQALRVKEAGRDAAQAEAGVAVQEKQAILNQKKFEATIITEATAKAKAALIDAENQQQVAERTSQRIVIESTGKANALVKEGEGQASKTRTIAIADAEATKVRLTAQAEGDKASLLAAAEGNKATLLAAADGRRASLLAEAEGNEKALLAVANGKRAALLAEAEGTEKLAEALEGLSESGRFIMVLDRLPLLLDRGGDAGAKMLAAMFGPLGESLGAIKSVSIVDMGGSGGKGLNGFASSIPSMVAEFFAKAKASGVDVTPLLKLLKMDPAKLAEMAGFVDVPADIVPKTDDKS
jgi:flotillin